jgi:hypothetical protein
MTTTLPEAGHAGTPSANNPRSAKFASPSHIHSVCQAACPQPPAVADDHKRGIKALQFSIDEHLTIGGGV